MRNLLLALAAAGIGAALVFVLTRDRPAAQAPAPRAFARALAYYLNENNGDYRRARYELLTVEEQFRDSLAWRIDMALIDLSELNYPVQGETDLTPDPPPYEKLLQSAARHLQRADAIEPGNETVAYNLARTYKKLAPHAANGDELRRAAEDLLRPLVARKDADPSALFLFAELRDDADDRQGALDAFKRVVDQGKDFVPQTLFRVSEFRYARALRWFDREASVRLQEELNRKYPERPKPTPGALERGRYTGFLEPGDPPVAAPDPRAMNWLRVTQRTGLPPIGDPPAFLVPDLDGDCARDIVLNGAGGVRVLRNRRNGSFRDLTEECGVPAGFILAGGAAGDVNGDGRIDLVLAGPAGVRVLLNVTDDESPSRVRFVDGTANVRGAERFAEPATCVVLWDLDHDGDLDLFVGGATNRVYRTAIETPPEGGRFLAMRDVTEQLGMASPPAREALLLDVDNDHDSDLLVAGAQGNAWFDNLRELRFEKRALPAGARLEAADVDNDLVEEIGLGGAAYDFEAGEWRRLRDAPALLDLDGDGVVDLDPLAGIEPRGELLRAVGADLNRDGNADLFLLTSAGLDVYMSSPERPAGWIDVQPRGDATNRMGLATRLRLFAGDLRIGATCRDGLVSFGLGQRPQVDALLVRWTNGVEQGVTPGEIAQCLRVDEREGEVGSCPFVYTFDGERWHFIADCNSGTPLGLPYADGKYLPARSNETIFIPGSRLAPVDGEFRLDLTEEFRELFYVDQVVLRAIDHPADARPVLNEGFRVTRFPEFAVHSLGDLRPPRSARDHKGRDLLELVSARDTRHAVVFDPLDGQYTGLAHPWSIELDFGDLAGAERVLLVMDGWVEFPTASASIAQSQTDAVHFRPPTIEVRGEDGAWVMADPDAGFPAGKGKAVLVDLTGKLPPGSGEIRLSSTQRLHWDAFLISTGPDREQRLTTLPLVGAEHGFHGVGVRVEEPGQPWRYSHDEHETFFRWDQMPAGMLTRYGDVRELLLAIDDRYPILASGDKVALRFDASALPPLPDGWARDYCFTTEGWVKDADLNQAIRESVLPLPFHAMTRYPYDETESHPHPDFAREWLTRPARRLVNPEALIAPKPAGPGGVEKAR